MVLSSMQLQSVSVTCDSAGFNDLYYVLFCLFLSTCVMQSVCVYTMDFVSGHKQINEIKLQSSPRLYTKNKNYLSLQLNTTVGSLISTVVPKVWVETQTKVGMGQHMGRAEAGAVYFQRYHCLSVSVCSVHRLLKKRVDC